LFHCLVNRHAIGWSHLVDSSIQTIPPSARTITLLPNKILPWRHGPPMPSNQPPDYLYRW
jgi:hypothetical protein